MYLEDIQQTIDNLNNNKQKLQNMPIGIKRCFPSDTPKKITNLRKTLETIKELSNFLAIKSKEASTMNPISVANFVRNDQINLEKTLKDRVILKALSIDTKVNSIVPSSRDVSYNAVRDAIRQIIQYLDEIQIAADQVYDYYQTLVAELRQLISIGLPEVRFLK